jgi:ribonuclease HI
MLQAPACSSTRTELAAGLVGLCADGPVHIGSDSKAFISRARRHVQAIRHGHQEPKWLSHTDGDLWQQFWHIVVIKGTHAVAFTKVKGHATAADLQHGISTAEHQAGNDMADSLATMAYKESDQQVGHLASFFCGREQRYIKLVSSIHAFVAHMLSAANAARDKHHSGGTVAARKGPATVSIARHLLYGNSEAATQLKGHQHDAAVYASMDEGQHRVLSMLLHYKWAVATDQRPGISWLELCALFFLHGGKHHHLNQQDSTQAHPAASLHQVLQAFRAKTKGVVTLHLTALGQAMFKPAKVATLRAKAIGYCNHTACITSWPVLTEQQAAHLTVCILELRQTFTVNSLRLLQQGYLQLIPKRFTYRAAVPTRWTTAREPFKQFSGQAHEEHTHRRTPDGSTSSSLDLTCSKCKNKLERGPTKPLLAGTKWRWLTCKQQECGQGASAAKWHCQCGKLWYACDLHAPSGHAIGRQHHTAQAKRKPIRRSLAWANMPPPIDNQGQCLEQPTHKRKASCAEAPNGQPYAGLAPKRHTSCGQQRERVEQQQQCPQAQPYATEDTTEPDGAAPATPQGAALAVTTTTEYDAVMTYATEVTTVPDDAASAAPQVDSSSQHAQQCAPGEAAAQHAMPSQAAPASSRSRAGTKRHVGEHAAARPAKRIRNSHAEDTAQAIAAIERLRRFRAEEAILKRDTG